MNDCLASDLRETHISSPLFFAVPASLSSRITKAVPVTI